MSEKIPRATKIETEQDYNALPEESHMHQKIAEHIRNLEERENALIKYAEELESRGLFEDGVKLRAIAEQAKKDAEEAGNFVQGVEKIERESRTDELTGLLNRRGFQEEWNRYTTFLKREGAKGVLIPSAFLAIDLDDFKLINDTVGHDAGDRFLELVAEKVKNIVRETDVFGRLGGDEFSVFLIDTSAPGAVEVAQSIRVAIESANSIMRSEYPEYRVNASASIGIATINGEGQLGDDKFTTLEQHPTMDAVKRYADYILYVEKKIGGKKGVLTLQEAWELDPNREMEKAFLSEKRK